MGLTPLILSLALNTLPAGTGPFYVDTGGDDDTGDGSSGNPWATLQKAVNTVPDGAEVIVRPGLYQGRQRLHQRFTEGIVVRSEVPYQARLRHTGPVVTFYDAAGVTLEGFDIAHDPGATALVVHVQTDAGPDASRIVLRDNILHDSVNNDILKINNGARDILVEGNLFYNQSGSDEHIDVNSVENVTVRGNVFFNDQAPGNQTVTSSYIVIKDSNGTDDVYLGAQDITVDGNVFLNWQGNAGANFVLIGEDLVSYHQAVGVLVENNLMLGNSAIPIRAPFGVKGSRDVVFRHNTVVGDFPGNAFAFRLNQEPGNLTNQDLAFYNNVWADPTASMGDFSDTPVGETVGVILATNLYYNGGDPVPEGATDLVNPSDDGDGVFADPELPTDQSGIVLPVYNAMTGLFADGSSRIAEVHAALVEAYARAPLTSPLVDRALDTQVPGVDILGQPRIAGFGDLGALEMGSDELLLSDGFEDP